MNNKTRAYDDLALRLRTVTETEQYQHQQKSRQAQLFTYETATEKRIEEMLLSHSRYYKYLS